MAPVIPVAQPIRPAVSRNRKAAPKRSPLIRKVTATHGKTRGGAHAFPSLVPHPRTIAPPSASTTSPGSMEGDRFRSERTQGFTESVIREMTRLAVRSGAVNLAQGFPDFPAPEWLKEAACDAIRADVNQYSITWGSKALRDAIARSTPGPTLLSRIRNAKSPLLRRNRGNDCRPAWRSSIPATKSLFSSLFTRITAPIRSFAARSALIVARAGLDIRPRRARAAFTLDQSHHHQHSAQPNGQGLLARRTAR